MSLISMISHDGRSLFWYDMEASYLLARNHKVKFSIELPVQFRDIDVMGHVNNATYLQYMETARVDQGGGIPHSRPSQSKWCHHQLFYKDPNHRDIPCSDRWGRLQRPGYTNTVDITSGGAVRRFR